MTSIEETASALVAWAKDAEVDFVVVDVGHLVVTLPCDQKLKTTVSVRFHTTRIAPKAVLSRRPAEKQRALCR